MVTVNLIGSYHSKSLSFEIFNLLHFRRCLRCPFLSLSLSLSLSLCEHMSLHPVKKGGNHVPVKSCGKSFSLIFFSAPKPEYYTHQSLLSNDDDKLSGKTREGTHISN